MNTKRVTVLPYDENWPREFLKIKAELEAALGETALRIEHVGSTSVAGLCAKPVIDLDVVIRDASAFPEAAEKLAKIGYEHEGDLGIPGREAFGYRGKEHLLQHHLFSYGNHQIQIIFVDDKSYDHDIELLLLMN